MKSAPRKSAKHSFYSSPPPFFCPNQNTIRLVYNEAFHMKLFFSVSAGVQLGWGDARGVSRLGARRLFKQGPRRRSRDWRLAQSTELYHSVNKQHGASFELQSLTDAFHGWLHKTHMLQSSTKGQTNDLNTLSGPQLPAIRETFGFPSAGRRFVKVLHDAWSS